jgi:hypothetical protein
MRRTEAPSGCGDAQCAIAGPHSIPLPMIVPSVGRWTVRINGPGATAGAAFTKVAPQVRAAAITIFPAGLQSPVNAPNVNPGSAWYLSVTAYPPGYLAPHSDPSAPHLMFSPRIVPPVGFVIVSTHH